MILAEDIVRPNAASKLPIARKGAALTQSLIDQLREMGVQSLVVEQNPASDLCESALEDARDQLAHRFKHLEEIPRMMEIKVIYEKRLIRKKEEAHEK